jgi:hypothetical protein
VAVSANHIKDIGVTYSDPARFRAVDPTCCPTLTGKPERLFLKVLRRVTLFPSDKWSVRSLRSLLSV